MISKFWLHFTCMLIGLYITKVKNVDTLEWNDFKTQFAKNYASSSEEELKMDVFLKNMDRIAKHNEEYKAGKAKFEMGINKFGDMTEEEFINAHSSKLTPSMDLKLNQLSGTRFGGEIVTSLPPNSRPSPEFKNWVTEGAVTEVKDQDNPFRCACCWAFCVAAGIESHNFIRTGNLVSLSEQNLLDCVGTQNGQSHTCDGGTMFYPFQYVIDNQGIDTEVSYPYIGIQNFCSYISAFKGATIKDFKQIEPNNEKLIKDITGVIGPVTCGYSIGSDFQFYKSGIYSSTKCGKTSKDLNHGVLVVGYGTENNTPYWLIKNSWGTEFGDNGYFKLLRGSNECGISVETYYPVP